MKKLYGCLFAVVVLTTNTIANAQDVAPGTNNGTLTTGEIGLSAGVLIFALVVIIAAVYMRIRQVMSGDSTFKLIGLAFVIGAGLFLITAGYTLDQITPVMGLLGTGLGFVFGKTFTEGGNQQPPTTPAAKPPPPAP